MYTVFQRSRLFTTSVFFLPFFFVSIFSSFLPYFVLSPSLYLSCLIHSFFGLSFSFPAFLFVLFPLVVPAFIFFVCPFFPLLHSSFPSDFLHFALSFLLLFLLNFSYVLPYFFSTSSFVLLPWLVSFPTFFFVLPSYFFLCPSYPTILPSYFLFCHLFLFPSFFLCPSFFLLSLPFFLPTLSFALPTFSFVLPLPPQGSGVGSAHTTEHGRH